MDGVEFANVGGIGVSASDPLCGLIFPCGGESGSGSANACVTGLTVQTQNLTLPPGTVLGPEVTAVQSVGGCSVQVTYRTIALPPGVGVTTTSCIPNPAVCCSPVFDLNWCVTGDFTVHSPLVATITIAGDPPYSCNSVLNGLQIVLTYGTTPPPGWPTFPTPPAPAFYGSVFIFAFNPPDPSPLDIFLYAVLSPNRNANCGCVLQLLFYNRGPIFGVAPSFCAYVGDGNEFYRGIVVCVLSEQPLLAVSPGGALVYEGGTGENCLFGLGGPCSFSAVITSGSP